MPGLVALEDVVEDAGSAGLREELGPEPDQPAGRDEVLQPHPPRAVVDHLLHPPLAQRKQLGEDADVLLRCVDRDPFDRLLRATVDLARHDLGLADRQLEALPPHELDQHRELELTATLHLPRVGPLGRRHAQRDVSDQLLIEPLLHHRRSQPRAFLARDRRRVDPDRHREARLVDGDHRKGPRILRVGQGLADRHLRDPRHCHDLSGPASSASTRSSASVT